MMRYATDLKPFLEAVCVAGGHPKTMVLPGPNTSAQMLDKTPGEIVFASLSNGAGLRTEGVYDAVFINVRTVGPRGDYDAAEDLAQLIDKTLCRITTPQLLGTSRVLYVTRTGGYPQLIDFDNGDRYHFQCTYVTETPSGF